MIEVTKLAKIRLGKLKVKTKWSTWAVLIHATKAINNNTASYFNGYALQIDEFAFHSEQIIFVNNSLFGERLIIKDKYHTTIRPDAKYIFTNDESPWAYI